MNEITNTNNLIYKASIRSSDSKSSRSTRSSVKKSISVKQSMSETSYLMRLANAKTPAQVANIVRLVKADAKAVKRNSQSSSEIKNAQKIAQTIEGKGKIKSARLHTERMMQQQADQQLAAKKLSRAKDSSIALSRKRRNRKAMESADVKNSAAAAASSMADERNKHFDSTVDEYTTLSYAESGMTDAASTVVDCLL